ncbi:hypothetical protein M0R45_019787 [Rubus argutus]|uniref:Uncharacterized protein n=1 Tax=Rubus argutus TaxID=59490 RepID=A0AAW1X7S5_RUBAR
MAGTTSGWRGERAKFRSLTRRTSGAVLEEVWRVGFTSAPHGLDGATVPVWINVREGRINGMGCSLVYYWIGVVIQAPSILATSICVWGRFKLHIRSLPVMVWPLVANFDSLELMGTPF